MVIEAAPPRALRSSIKEIFSNCVTKKRFFSVKISAKQKINQRAHTPKRFPFPKRTFARILFHTYTYNTFAHVHGRWRLARAQEPWRLFRPTLFLLSLDRFSRVKKKTPFSQFWYTSLKTGDTGPRSLVYFSLFKYLLDGESSANISFLFPVWIALFRKNGAASFSSLDVRVYFLLTGMLHWCVKARVWSVLLTNFV